MMKTNAAVLTNDVKCWERQQVVSGKTQMVIRSEWDFNHQTTHPQSGIIYNRMKRDERHDATSMRTCYKFSVPDDECKR